MTNHPPRYAHHLPHLVALTLWVYRRLLIMHPPAFRRDFGGAILQVFRQTCLDAYQTHGPVGVIGSWFPAFGDLVAGALAENAMLVASLLKGSSPVQMYRRSVSVVFGAFVAFVLAGTGFSKMSETVMKSSLPTTYPVFRITYDAMMVLAVVALGAVAIGGIPIALAALRFARTHRRRDILARFAVPPLALLVILAYPLVMFVLGPGKIFHAFLHPFRLVGVGFIGVMLVAVVASTAALLDAIRRSELDERLLRFTPLPGTLATLAMVGMTLDALLWNVSFWRFDPALFWGNDGIFASSTLISVLVQMGVMVIGMVVAIRAAKQGLTARRTAVPLA